MIKILEVEAIPKGSRISLRMLIFKSNPNKIFNKIIDQLLQIQLTK